MTGWGAIGHYSKVRIVPDGNIKLSVACVVINRTSNVPESVDCRKVWTTDSDAFS